MFHHEIPCPCCNLLDNDEYINNKSLHYMLAQHTQKKTDIPKNPEMAQARTGVPKYPPPPRFLQTGDTQENDLDFAPFTMTV